MKLNVISLSQKDPRWKSKKIGTSNQTIGSVGCAITSVSMLLNYYGHSITPDVLNELLIAHNGYQNKNLIKWEVVSQLFNDIVWDGRVDSKPTILGKIDEYLQAKKPIIVGVDYNPSTPQQEQHFVLIIGKDEQGSYLINDPVGGETYYLQAKYGEPSKAIFGLRLYSGAIPSLPPSEVGDLITIDTYKKFVEDLIEVAKPPIDKRDIPSLVGWIGGLKSLADQKETTEGKFKVFTEEIGKIVECKETTPEVVKMAVKGFVATKNDEILTITKKRLVEFSKTDLLVGLIYKLLARR